MPLALDIPRLLKRIAHCETDTESSREYQRVIVDEFTRRGDKIMPIAIQRWRQRGSMPTARMLTLLLIAQDRGVPINLLDFAIPGSRVEDFRRAERVGKRHQRSRQRQERLRQEAEDQRESA